MPSRTVPQTSRSRSSSMKKPSKPNLPSSLLETIAPALPSPPSCGTKSTIEHTNGEDASSSKANSPTMSKFDLDEHFPAAFNPSTLTRLLEKSQTMNEVRAVASVFVQCMDALMKSMDRLPCDVRLDSAFQLAQNGVQFTKDLFVTHTSQSHADLSDVDAKESIQMASELLGMNIAGLKSFLRVAEHALIHRKPLPNLPEDNGPDLESVEPTTEDFDPSFTEEPSAAFPASPDEADEETISLRDEKDAPSFSFKRKRSMFARFLVRAGKAHLSSLSLNATRSLLTLSDSVKNNTTDPADNPPNGPPSPQSGLDILQYEDITQDGAVKPDSPPGYNIRDSLFIFPDPAAPECDVQMPRPVGDAFDLYLNDEGIVTKASLSALITMLTSKECVTDYEFMDMFFVCFRFFSSPVEVFERLLVRYDEQVDEPLTEAQLRVWEREAVCVKVRVAKILHTWLDLHWRQDRDQEVFKPLLDFVYKRLAKELPIGLSVKITEALTKCAADSESYRGRRLQRRTQVAQMSLKLEEALPTGFDHPMQSNMCQGDFTDVDVLNFHSPRGCEELARQLTLRASQLYCRIDPEDAVTFWREGGNEEIGRQITAVISFEKAIFFWVIYTILSRSTPIARAVIVTFWLELASICVRLRNFSVASAVFGAVDNPPIFRLRHTIEEVFRSHKHDYDDLDQLFLATGNYRNYRAALRSSEMPAVPLLRVLIHDIYATKEASPKVELSPENKTLVINVSTYRIVAKVVRAMELCHVPYKLSRVDYIQAWLEHVLHDFMDVEDEAALSQEFDDRSLSLEPRQTKQPPMYSCPSQQSCLTISTFKSTS